MNIDAKFPKTYLQTEFNSTLKVSYNMIKWDLSLGGKNGSTYANQSLSKININRIKDKIMWSCQ